MDYNNGCWSSWFVLRPPVGVWFDIRWFSKIGTTPKTQSTKYRALVVVLNADTERHVSPCGWSVTAQETCRWDRHGVVHSDGGAVMERHAQWVGDPTAPALLYFWTLLYSLYSMLTCRRPTRDSRRGREDYDREDVPHLMYGHFSSVLTGPCPRRRTLGSAKA
jgi:hypothetical protein